MVSGDPFLSKRSFKVVVSFFPVGSAPRLKVSKFTIDGTLRFDELTTYLSKMVNSDDVHLYVSGSIEPMEDQYLGDLVRMFGKAPATPESVGNINIHYSLGKAYM
jgi:hypothetical protein